MGCDGPRRVGKAAGDEGGWISGHVVAVAGVQDAARADVGGELESGCGLETWSRGNAGNVVGCAYVAEWLTGDGGVVALEAGVGGAAFVAAHTR